MTKPAIYYVNYFCMDDSLDDAKIYTPRDEHEDIRAYVELESYDKLQYDWDSAYGEKLKENEKLKADRAVLVEALNSIIAKSHSWLIDRENEMIKKPIHDSYRNLAKSILQKIGEVKECL